MMIALLVGLPANAAAANQAQHGSSVDCADYMALYMVPGVHSPTGATVTVDPGTGYEASSANSDAWVLVDFYDAQGNNVGYDYGDPATGTVPANAAYGIVCVSTIDAAFFADASGAWTYQDGF